MAHIHKEIDFTVTAVIIYSGKVLLVLHQGLNKWLPVGGHIELNEDPEQALFREIEEEAGLKKKDLKIFAEKPDLNYEGMKFLYSPTFLDIHEIRRGHRHTAFIYFFKSSTDKIKLKVDEHLDIKWFSKKELEEKKYKITPKVKFLAGKAFEIST